MQINPDSRSMQGVMTFISFVGLNTFYILLCLPVVTIGAATSALYEVTLRYADHEKGELVKDFFPAFLRNFVRSTLLALVLLVPAAALAFSAVFWSQQTSLLAWAAMAFGVIGAGYLFTAFLFAMALVATYTNSFGRTLRNALQLPMAEPIRGWGILLIPLALGSIAAVFPTFSVVLLTIGFSFGAYMSAFLFRQIFTRHTAA